MKKQSRSFGLRRTFVYILLAVIVYSMISCSDNAHNPNFSDEEVKSTIQSFLENRYESVSIFNIEERMETANSYYSESFLNSESPLLSKEQQRKGIEYYQNTGYVSAILSVYTEAMQKQSDCYMTHAAVLYFTDDHTNDSVVNYIFEFFTATEPSGCVFDRVEITGNEVLYIPNGEVHVADGVAHVVSDTCDHNHEHAS